LLSIGNNPEDDRISASGIASASVSDDAAVRVEFAWDVTARVPEVRLGEVVAVAEERGPTVVRGTDDDPHGWSREVTLGVRRLAVMSELGDRICPWSRND